jgi:hypothetical protein
MTDTTVTTSATSGISTAAATAEKVVEVIGSVSGPILTGVSLFVPGAAAITVPMETILPLILPDIEKALNDISQGTYGDIFSVLSQFVSHISAGKPNSPILSAIGTAASALAQKQATPSSSTSAQGSA